MRRPPAWCRRPSAGSKGSWLEAAVARSRLVDAGCRAIRDQARGEDHEIDGSLVPSDVDHVPRVDENVTGLEDLGSARRIIPSIEGERAGLHDDEARPRVAVPPEG